MGEEENGNGLQDRDLSLLLPMRVHEVRDQYKVVSLRPGRQRLTPSDMVLLENPENEPIDVSISLIRQDLDALLAGELPSPFDALLRITILHCWNPDRYRFLSDDEVNVLVNLPNDENSRLCRIYWYDSLVKQWLTAGQIAKLALQG